MTLENEGPQVKHGYTLAPMLVGKDLVVEMQSIIGFDRETGKLNWKVPGSGGSLPLRRQAEEGRPDRPRQLRRARRLQAGPRVLPVVPHDAGREQLWRITHRRQHGLPLHASRAADRSAEPPADGMAAPWFMPDDRIYIPGGYNWGDGLVQANPLFYDGLIYTDHSGRRPARGGEESRARVYARLLDLMPITYAYPYPHGSGVCASPTLAGKYIYLFGTNGLTLVIKPGRTYERVAKNRIERLLPGRLEGDAPTRAPGPRQRPLPRVHRQFPDLRRQPALLSRRAIPLLHRRPIGKMPVPGDTVGPMRRSEPRHWRGGRARGDRDVR